MVLFGLGCKLPRGEPVQARMWSVVVIVVTPAVDDLSCVAITPEQMLVQAFVSQATVERFNEAVL